MLDIDPARITSNSITNVSFWPYLLFYVTVGLDGLLMLISCLHLAQCFMSDFKRYYKLFLLLTSAFFITFSAFLKLNMLQFLAMLCSISCFLSNMQSNLKWFTRELWSRLSGLLFIWLSKCMPSSHYNISSKLLICLLLCFWLVFVFSFRVQIYFRMNAHGVCHAVALSGRRRRSSCPSGYCVYCVAGQV